MRSYLNLFLGNSGARERLGTSAERGSISHAFLLEGARGSGRHTLVRELAAALNCENKADLSQPLPCHVCNNCRRIREGNFPDLKIFKKQKDKASIGVEEIRLFREDMFLSATESEYKIYAIENAELMTPQAQNALLKILEEPPRNVIIMLLAETADKILTTVKSRTQYVALSRFRAEELCEHVRGLSREADMLARSEPERFKSIILEASGCIGRALELIDPKASKESEQRRAVTESIVKKILQGAPYSELLSAMGSLPQKRQELTSYFETVLNALRDVIAKKMRTCAEPLFFTDEKELESLASRVDVKRVYALFELICAAHEENSKNANISSLITNLTAKIKECR